MTEATTWCDVCRQEILDVFEDHFDQHSVMVDRPDTIANRVTFWAFCVGAGVIAGLLVGLLI